MSLVIAIDGPSGSGKSTLAKRLAAHYGLQYLDTGSMYRVATVWCLDTGIDLDDQHAVAEATRAMPLEMVTDPAGPRVVLDGTDVTDRLHTGEISTVVSKLAVNLAVRAEMKARQRGIIEYERTGGRSGGRGIVAEGRDITTVVAPDADVRILLIADPSDRLARRAMERHGAADERSIEATRDEVIRRDTQDSTVSEFMHAHEGVVTLDNSGMVPDETFATARAIVDAAVAGR
ncbi:MAG: (d)CMP kinase [Actinomycetota bacterium]